MSALIDKPTDYGAPATFWRLYGVDIRRSPASIRIIIAGYLSSGAYATKAAPLALWERTYQESELPFDINDLQPGTAAYELFGVFYDSVMADNFFEGAVKF